MILPVVALFLFYTLASFSCYQIIHVEPFERGYDNTLDASSCQWKYLCVKKINFCEHGCCLSKRLIPGYNFINTRSIHEKCYINIKCKRYYIYFDTENAQWIHHFSHFYLLLNPHKALYLKFQKRKEYEDEDEDEDEGEENATKQKKSKWMSKGYRKGTKARYPKEETKYKNDSEGITFFAQLLYYRKLLKNKFQKIIVKLFIYFNLMFLIFGGLFIYNYIYLKKKKLYIK